MAINSWATSTSAVIATNSMLNSIMITPSYTSVIATTYVGKDIIGQLGSLFYVWKSGSKADKEPLKHITKGVAIQQSSFYMENASILIQNTDLVLPFLGASSMLKNVSFICTGAVNAGNLQKLSKERIGELYSKVAGVNTLASTLGMISGIVLIHILPSYEFRSAVCLPILSLISLYTSRKATQLVNSV